MKPYYEDSYVTLWLGDCREVTAWLSGDVLVTDPLYGESHRSGWDGRFKGVGLAGDDSTALRDWVCGEWGARPAAVFGKWSVPKWGKPRGVLVWDKGPASGMGDLSFPWKPSWEDVSIYGEGWVGARDEGVLKGYTVVTWSGRGDQRLHPTEKPVDLLRHIIGKAPHGTIVDPFAGSGSTLRAAKDLRRKAIGIELEERYCEVAAQRCLQETLELGA